MLKHEEKTMKKTLYKGFFIENKTGIPDDWKVLIRTHVLHGHLSAVKKASIGGMKLARLSIQKNLETWVNPLLMKSAVSLNPKNIKDLLLRMIRVNLRLGTAYIKVN